MLVRQATLVIFVSCVLLSIVSLGIAFISPSFGILLVITSIAANLIAIFISERKGFSRTTQLRRAFEPARSFNSAQVGVLILLMMAQITAGMYALLAT